jgi:hypothetical protein
MACLSTPKKNQTLSERIKEVDSALKRLEQYLQTGTVRVGIGTNGALVFNGWQDRDGISDVCAFQSLSVQNSWVLRQSILKAEGMSGRKVNPKAIAAGYHSHDNGHTFSKH